MSTENTQPTYGFEDDEIKVSPFNFGLNAGKTFLKKFEWTPTGGKDGAAQEALDIVFEINGTEKSHRMFPVTKAFLKDGGETTDPNSPEFKAEVKAFNAMITHIVTCFVDRETYKQALSRPIPTFNDFCTLVKSLLPKDTPTKPLDIFMQYQWQPGEGKERTYLEIPKNLKHGNWLCSAQKGPWEKHLNKDADDSEREALYYTSGERKHPFTRTGWYVKSNFANGQGMNSGTSNSSGGTTTETPAAAAEAQNAPSATQSW